MRDSVVLLQLLVFNFMPLPSQLQRVQYVIPESTSTCPRQPCLTFYQCCQLAEECFSSGSTVVFMAGNYTLEHTVNLTNISDIILQNHSWEKNSQKDINILFENEAVLSFMEATNLTIKGLKFSCGTSFSDVRLLLNFLSSKAVITETLFQGGGSINGIEAGLAAVNSSIEICDSLFQDFVGLAIATVESNITISGCIFTGNINGTINGLNSSLTLVGRPANIFANNSRTHYGGVLSCYNCTISLLSYNRFESNSAGYGGVMYLTNSVVNMSGNTTFLNNSANIGGAIFSSNTNFQNARYDRNCQTQLQTYFIGNTATDRGGAAFLVESHTHLPGYYFINNTAGGCGGALYLADIQVYWISGLVIRGSKGSAICISNSNISFSGTNEIVGNAGNFGGGIHTEESSIIFFDNFTLENNSGQYGGAIYAFHGSVQFEDGIFLISHNEAKEDGGAIYALEADIILNFEINCTYNTATNGGALYLRHSRVIFHSLYLNATHNSALKYGGVIYHEDIATPVQCSFIASNSFPECFLQQEIENIIQRFHAFNNSAKKGGNFLYGGLLDRCRMTFPDGTKSADGNLKWLFNYVSNETVTSKPFQLCFCSELCSEETAISVYKGQRITLSLEARDQTHQPVSAIVKVKISTYSRIGFNRAPHSLSAQCSKLMYKLYSFKAQEQLVLYPDGPCKDTGHSRLVFNVTLLPCPDALIESGDHCVCEDQLQEHAECTVDDKIYISKKSDSKVWITLLYDKNSSYQGLVLYESCPVEYCTSNENTTLVLYSTHLCPKDLQCTAEEAIQATLDSLGTQCYQNRSGILCGACATNYSLMLGSTHCKICSNAYLALLVPFAAVGILLVFLMSVLRLTVASGLINSIIFYANIVQANRNIFLAGEANFLTVFIAWLNFDLGFQTCFYDGMDAYSQTWLQFAFPLYIWLLIGTIVLASRHSVIISKLIGHNPVAVLATLLLMSYAKFLKNAIEVYTSVQLNYPTGKVTVWLKDANIPFLESRHLFLAIATTIFLTVFFLPYTLFLLIGYKLYFLSGQKCFGLVNRMKPLLDSYYAPYKPHTRYWTGFLLLVRCTLFVVFSFNSLGGETKSLLAILLTFTAMFVVAWLSGKLYNSFAANAVEAAVYVNLMALSGLTLAGANSPALVYSLIGAVFIKTVVIFFYHFHIAYFAKIWLRVSAKFASVVKSVKEPAQTELATQPANKEISKTVVDLREPLLDDVKS